MMCYREEHHSWCSFHSRGLDAEFFCHIKSKHGANREPYAFSSECLLCSLFVTRMWPMQLILMSGFVHIHSFFPLRWSFSIFSYSYWEYENINNIGKDPNRKIADLVLAGTNEICLIVTVILMCHFCSCFCWGNYCFHDSGNVCWNSCGCFHS